MSYENWWEGTDEDFKRSLIDEELIKDKDLQENPIATEGWGVFLAKGLSKVGINFLENKLSQRSADKIMSVFKEPRVAQWIDIQAKLILKQASLYAKKFIDPNIKMTFATPADIDKYIDNPLNGIINYDGTAKVTPDIDFKKYFVFNIISGKYMLQINADSNSIKRVFLVLKSSENYLCFAIVKAPDDQELLKIVGAIESCEIVEEGLISKIKSFIGSKEIKKVRPKRDPKATLSAAKAVMKKALTMDEFKVLKPYIGFDSHVDLDEFGKYGVVFARLEFKFNLPGVDRDGEAQEDAFWPIWEKFMEKVNELLDDPAYEIFAEGKAKDAVIELDYNDKVAITDEAAELLDFSYGVEQVSESLFTLDNLDDSTKMMLFGTAAFGVVSAGVGFLKHIGYELGDTVGKGIRNKLNNREYKRFIRAVNDPEVQRFLKEQCNEVFEEAKKKFPNVTKKVSAVDGKAVESGAKKVKTSKGIIGRFFSSPNIIPVKAGEYLVILDGTPSEGVKTAVVVLQDADTKKYICSLLTPPTLTAESLGLGAMLGAAAVGTFIGKQIKKNRDAKRKELAAAMKAESDEDYKAYLKKAEAWIPSRKKAINEAISIVKKYWTYTSFYPNPKGFCYDQFISGREERVCIGSIREILDEEFYKVLDKSKAIINKELFKRFKGKYVVYFGPEYLFGEDEDDEFDRKAGEGYVALVDMQAVKEYNKYSVKINGWPTYTIDFGTRKPLTESFDVATEGFGVKAANSVESTGWSAAFFGCLATIFSFGYALKFKGIWAMIIGGYAVDKIGGGIKDLLQKKGNKYLEKVLANPEMSAYIRSAAKEVVAGIKKQAASMKDSKYEISTKAEDIDKFQASVFNQGFKAPGEETDERIDFDRKSYFYIEKKLGEYTIVLLYDTNSIKGIYVVVAIKDTKDKFGSSWLRARPIPPPTSEELKKMGFKD